MPLDEELRCVFVSGDSLDQMGGSQWESGLLLPMLDRNGGVHPTVVATMQRIGTNTFIIRVQSTLGHRLTNVDASALVDGSVSCVTEEISLSTSVGTELAAAGAVIAVDIVFVEDGDCVSRAGEILMRLMSGGGAGNRSMGILTTGGALSSSWPS